MITPATEFSVADVLALANTYLTLRDDYDAVNDRLHDLQMNADYGMCDDEFRDYLDALNDCRRAGARLADCALGAYQALYAICETLPAGLWTLTGRGLTVRYEPVAHLVTVVRAE